MTNEQAIKSMQNLDMVISITESEHESVKLAIEALEKQIPKKATQGKEFYWIDRVKFKGRYIDARKKSYSNDCPTCGKTVAKLSNEYCGHCGQMIDWSVEE